VVNFRLLDRDISLLDQHSKRPDYALRVGWPASDPGVEIITPGLAVQVHPDV